MSNVNPCTNPVSIHSAGKIFSNNIFIFCLFSLGFVLWRHGYSLVWDDTSVYKLALQSAKDNGTEDLLALYQKYFFAAFSSVSPSGYRPIAGLLQGFFVLSIDSLFPSWGHLLFISCFIGGLAVAFKSVTARFIKSRQLVFFCLVLFMLSSPIAQSNWISYSGIPVLVPLFTCIGLLLYFAIGDNPKEGSLKLGLLALLVIFATLYREFMIALPLTILGMEIIQTRRITKISLLAGILILFSLFPTVIPRLMFHMYSDLTGLGKRPEDNNWLVHGMNLPLKTTFQLGNVHQELSRTFVIKEEVSRHLLSIPSPSLLILTFSGFVSLVLVKLQRQIVAGKLNLDEIIGLIASVLGLVTLAGIAATHAFWPYHCGVLTLILIAWVVDRRLAVWIAVYLGPFYLVYTERLHLAYVMMPLSIVVVAVLEQCWAAQPFSGKPRILVRYGAGIAIAIGVLDAFANPIAVREVMSQISDGVEIVADKIGERPSERPVAIIGNAVHVDELRLYLNNNYQLLWTIPTGHDRPQDVVETPEQLEKFLKAKLPTTDVYFLDFKQDYLPRKKDYHQHRFVAACSVNTDDLGSLRLTRAEYFMPDPLRWFGKREYFAFFGPPDLVDDFYYGPSPRPLFGKVEVDYHLYKVTSSEVKNWLPLGRVSIIDKNYLGFSIVSQNDRFFAVPVGEGKFAYDRACRKGYSTFLEASSYDEIEAMVNGVKR
ncbi:MAG: hypothetical protein M0Q44_05425 [Methylobacter sp.]|nr:hypothetical protein [Methylobacter sp.]